VTALAGGTGCESVAGHTSHTYRFIAEGSPRRAHVKLKIGSFVHVDAARNLPWHTRETVAPHQFVDFSVTLIDVRNVHDHVSCTVLDPEGREVARGRPAAHADCSLAALEIPA
jgi:hypothetical protein